LQFSSEALAFPTNYQTEAARIVRDRGGDPATARVSYPRMTIAAAVMGPKRWFVCVSGVPAPPGPTSIPKAVDLADHWLMQRPSQKSYYVVLFFPREVGRPTAKDGWNSPLCRGAEFEPIAADAPLT
jgi:hypothetical protein